MVTRDIFAPAQKFSVGDQFYIKDRAYALFLGSTQSRCSIRSKINTDTINTTNGNLMINLALRNLPAGRGSASAGVYLTYNSKLYNMRTERRPDRRRAEATYNRTVIEPDLNKGGWRLASGYVLEIENRFLHAYIHGQPL